MENKKLIESIYILKGTITDAEYQEVFGNIKKKLSQFKIEKVEELGKKNLAYEVKNNKQGYYIVIEFYADNEDVKELESYCRQNENILKWLFVRKEI